jgi:hypothetical protein
VAAALRKRAAEPTADRPMAVALETVADLPNVRHGAATGRMGLVPGPQELPAPGKVARPGRGR